MHLLLLLSLLDFLIRPCLLDTLSSLLASMVSQGSLLPVASYQEFLEGPDVQVLRLMMGLRAFTVVVLLS